MEKRDDNAKYVGWIVYIFLAVISILASFIEHETSDLFEAMVIVYFVITMNYFFELMYQFDFVNFLFVYVLK